jgi:hypothetical protein
MGKNRKKERKKEWEEINNRFYFLPEGGIAAAVLAYPFALYAGLEAKRFGEILDGSEPDFEEIELIIWSCDIGLNLTSAATTKDLLDKTDTLNEAMEIAAEYLDQEEARKALDLTIKSLQNVNAEGTKIN